MYTTIIRCLTIITKTEQGAVKKCRNKETATNYWE
jgi:hypothetical protein